MIFSSFSPHRRRQNTHTNTHTGACSRRGGGSAWGRWDGTRVPPLRFHRHAAVPGRLREHRRLCGASLLPRPAALCTLRRTTFFRHTLPLCCERDRCLIPPPPIYILYIKTVHRIPIHFYLYVILNYILHILHIHSNVCLLRDILTLYSISL